MRDPSASGDVVAASPQTPSLEAHFEIARVDHLNTVDQNRRVVLKGASIIGAW